MTNAVRDVYVPSFYPRTYLSLHLRSFDSFSSASAFAYYYCNYADNMTLSANVTIFFFLILLYVNRRVITMALSMEQSRV